MQTSGAPESEEEGHHVKEDRLPRSTVGIVRLFDGELQYRPHALVLHKQSNLSSYAKEDDPERHHPGLRRDEQQWSPANRVVSSGYKDEHLSLELDQV